MITLALGVMALKIYDFYEGKLKGWIAVLIIAIVAQFIKADYGIFGIFLMFSFYIFKDSKIKTFFASFVVVSLKYLYRIIILGVGFTEYPIKNWICTVVPLIIILFYNHKKGPGMKWLFYIFYPLHLFILYLISPYTFNLLHL